MPLIYTMAAEGLIIYSATGFTTMFVIIFITITKSY
jgi:hypothetical protein